MLLQNAFFSGGFPVQDAQVVSPPARGKLRTGYLHGLTHMVRSRGGDPFSIYEREDIDPRIFDDPDSDIECLAAVNLLEYCSRFFKDSLFGLHLADQQDPDVFGCVVALARSAPSMRDALESLVEYVPISASPECALELVTGQEVVELRWSTPIGLGDMGQVYYHGLLVMMKTLQMLGRESFRPRYASLNFPVRRTDIQLLQDRLGCLVHSRSEINAIAFSADVLDRPIATSNRVLFQLLSSGLSQLQTKTKGGFVAEVESFVRQSLTDGRCTVDLCARHIGTSTRTLQKRLTLMGLKFSDIVQSERIKLAKHALMWSECSLDEIAFQLGYSEQTSFGRAFKRSTGMTPKAFRLSERRHH